MEMAKQFKRCMTMPTAVASPTVQHLSSTLSLLADI